MVGMWDKKITLSHYSLKPIDATNTSPVQLFSMGIQSRDTTRLLLASAVKLTGPGHYNQPLHPSNAHQLHILRSGGLVTTTPLS